MLNWAQQFNIFCFLDNQQYATTPHTVECVLAAGAAAQLQGGYRDLEKIDPFLALGTWTFGHLSYELLHPLYGIATTKKDSIGFPPFFFFHPHYLVSLNGNNLQIEADDPHAVYNELMAWAFEKVEPATELEWQQVLSKEAYLQCVRQLQQHMLRGDCYEVNFCASFFAENATIHPAQVFQTLMKVSPNPFSAFYKVDDKYLLCASPERFAAKQGNKLLVQPIKGTAKRSLQTEADAVLKQTLQQSPKEQAENVMIVDLMRNDLSKICTQGSVQVEELFGVYTFPQVHQLISTISGTLKNETKFSEIIEALFPMGSMTGAPKRRVLELIEQYEPTSRGIFSGSVGYVASNGDFDFNVVIRSLMYNQTQKYLSYQVGSGITFYSDAEGEWEECLLKASAIKKVLTA